MKANNSLFRIHHLGYAVRSLPEGLAAFRSLGYEPAGPATEDAARNVRIQFVRKDGWLVELVAPLGKGSPIDRILANGSGSPYHVCYAVESIAAALDELKGQGFMPFTACAPAPAIGACQVMFLLHKVMGVIELVELPQKAEPQWLLNQNS